MKRLVLGLPKGFTQMGEVKIDPETRQYIRLWTDPASVPSSFWNHLNVPAWAMVKDGYLFVRTYSPRINLTFIDIVAAGTLKMVPGAVDVGKFVDDIDP